MNLDKLLKIVMSCILITTSIMSCYAGDNSSYSMKLYKKYGKKISIYHNNKLISHIRPKYKKQLSNLSIFKDDETFIVPIYDKLCERGSLKSQPKPFDDITGDGKPNFICIERQSSLSNHGPWMFAIRVFAFENGKVLEYTTLFNQIGEALHFDDFNKDGILELVNTDNEKDFIYSKEGLPISPYVWSFDEQYRQTDKLDTHKNNRGIDKKLDGLLFRVKKGRNESFSIGSYSVHVYDASDKRFTFDSFITGLIRHRHGAIVDFWVADINHNKKPDIHIWIRSVGSGAYGEIHSYELDKNELTLLNIPDINKEQHGGYRGYDVFYVTKNRLHRSFVIYNQEDANALPTAGHVSFVYNLAENKWIEE